ncbi:MAG: polyvinylalcohol dehydrogenase [Acidobacteria bacterium]|nr:MAG: polyvinylalcohol dehydrogenase [Acidobacteriota bacterium]
MARIAAVLLISLTAAAGDWPQWRGPNRDGISSETGLLTSWPAGGPRVVWKTTGLGEGYSSFSVVKGRLYTQGQRGDQEYVYAFDIKTGTKLWEVPTGRPYREQRGNGPRGTPTIDGDRLYAMAADGKLVCLEVATGEVLWSQNVVQKYGASVIHWGMSESPLVDGNRLIVMPGGPGASVVSLNKLNGELQWKTGSDSAGYSSAIVADVEGVRQILALSGQSAIGILEQNGELLWRYTKVSNGTANIATPIYYDGHVFVSSNYGTGCALLKLGPRTMSEVYFNRDMMNHYSTSVLVDGTLYGYSNNILTAMDFKTGKVLWRNRSVGKGSAIYADKHLYVLGEDGVLGLVEASPSAYKEVSRFEIRKGDYPTWTPLVISDAKMYLRDQDNLTCFDIKANK